MLSRRAIALLWAACAAPALPAQSAANAGEDAALVQPEPKAAQFFGSREDGWFWRKDPYLLRQPAPAAGPAAKPAMTLRRAPELSEFEQLQKVTEEAHRIAIMNPTEEHIYRYLRLLRYQMEKVSVYTDLAQQVAWKFPELSPSPDEVRPANVRAMSTFDAQRDTERAQRLRAVAQTYGIYFFFRSDCPYCHAYAPLLRAFAQQFGFSILAVSLDGLPIPGFEQFINDNGSAAALGVTQWPATFLVNPHTRDVMPVGSGVLNADELVERIFQLLKYREATIQARVAANASPPGQPTTERQQ